MNLSNLISFKKNQPITAARSLHCVFYSHIWTVYLLEELGLLNPKTDIILELATESNFAAALNPSNSTHKNLLGLLQQDVHLHQLGDRFKNINAPMVLAPHHPISLNIILSALALVSTDNSPIEKAVVLVHINDAPQFVATYHQMRYFSILWDIADYPSANLAALAELLATEQCLDEQSWRGVQLCHHKQRQLPDSEDRTAILNQLIDEFAFVRAV
jgi:hypothetical protein